MCSIAFTCKNARLIGVPDTVAIKPTWGFSREFPGSKPGLTTQIGHLQQRDEKSIEYVLTVARNSLYFLEMLAGKLESNDDAVIYETIVYVNSGFDGFFTPRVTIGDQVKPGTLLGEVIDYFGTVVQQLNSAESGTILMINETPRIKKIESPVAIGIVQ